MRRRTLWLSIGFSSLGLSCVVALTSDWGLRGAIGLARTMIPGELSLETADGSLLGPIDITGLSYQNASFSLQLERLHVEWDPWALLDAQIHVTAVQLTNPRVRTFKSKETPPGFAVDWALFGTGIKVDQLHSTGGSLALGTSTPIQIQRADLATSINSNQISLTNARFESALLTVSGNATVTRATLPGMDDALQGTLAWSARPEGIPPLAGIGEFKGRWNAIEITHKLTLPVAIQSTASLSNLTKSPHWEFQSKVGALVLAKLNPAWPLNAMATDLKAEGDFSNAHFRLDLAADVEPMGASVAHVAGHVSDWAQLTLTDIRVEWPKANMFAEGAGGLVFSQNTPILGLRGRWKNLHWPMAAPDSESPSGTFELAGTFEQYTVSVDALLRSKTAQIFDHQATWRAKLDLTGQRDQRWDVSRLNLEVPDSTTHLSSTGFVQRNSAGLTWDVNGAWWDIDLPTPQAGSRSHYGRYHLQGMPQSYQLSLDTSLTLPPNIAVSANGVLHGDQNGFDQVELAARGLGGELRAQGSMGWQPSINWSLSAHAEGIDPSQVWYDWPGNLGGDVVLKGSNNAQGLDLDISSLNINGVLRDYPLTARAAGRWQNDKLNLTDAHITSGSAVLDVSGTLGANQLFNYKLDAPDLAALWPHTAGSVESQGTIGGTPRTATINGHAHGKGVRYANYAAADVNAHWDIDLSNRNESRIAASATDVVVGDQTFSRADARLAGTTDAHSISATVAREDSSIELGGSGNWRDKRWLGEISRIALSHPDFGEWQLQDPFGVELFKQNARVDRACLTSNNSTVCAQGTLDSDGTIAGTGNVRNLSTQLFSQWMPEQILWTSTLDADARWSVRSNTPLQLNANVVFNEGNLALRYNPLELKPLAYTGGNARLKVDDSGADINFDVRFAGTDKIKGLVLLPQFASATRPPPNQPIQGELEATWTDLAALSTVYPALEAPKGEIALKTRISGTLAKPTLNGTIALNNGSVGLPEAGVRITQLSLQGQSEGAGKVSWNGAARSGDGQIAFTGTTALDPEKRWPTQIHVTGESFELVRKPGMWVVTSPDLHVNVAYPDIKIDGDVTIPRGTFEARASSSAIYPSSDVTLINQPEQQAAPIARQRLKVTYNVRTVLGERVNVEAFGLTGRLEGSVLVHREPDKPTTGVGEVIIRDGRYRFYGSVLDISSGRLIFASGPAANPDIDIRATRVIDDPLAPATVGVQARGRIKDPVFTLYSTPAMEDTNVLSYLLLGRPVLQADTSEAEFLANAVSAITLTRGYDMAKRLAVTLGIEDTRLNSRGIFLGRALSPRLYMSYEIGLFEPANTFQLRYMLTKHWQIKTESGRNNMADLLYTVEH